MQLGLPYYQLVLQILQCFAGGALVVTLWVEESMKEVEFHLLIQTRFQNAVAIATSIEVVCISH